MRGAVDDDRDGVADVETPVRRLRHDAVRTRARASIFEVCVIEVFVNAEFEANRRVRFDAYRLWPGDISGDHVQKLGQCEPVVGLVGLYDNVVGIGALADTV